MPFIVAALAVGVGDARIIFRHLLPNVVAPSLILLAAFLDLGVNEPTPAWGLMLRGAGV